MSPMPSLFVSHGPPTLVLQDVPVRAFLAGYGEVLGRPSAIVAVSAHWEAPIATVSSAPVQETIHDFHGFPPELYEQRYPAPGDPALAARVVELLEAAGIPARADPDRGLDHGAWVPLSLMYPAAGVPTIQVSIDPDAGPAYHLALGAALAGLRQENVLLLASGNVTHNLRAFAGNAVDEAPPGWVSAFADWLARTVAADDVEALLQYRQRAPHAIDNHPRDEHLLPLFAALGAAGDERRGRRVHESTMHAVLSMDAYAFG